MKTLKGSGAVEASLRNLLGYMRVGLTMEGEGEDTDHDVAIVSAMALTDVLAPLDRVDLIDIDIQGDEAPVLPQTIGMMECKVRRVHLGTHNMERHGGMQLNADMVRLFKDAG